MRKWEVFKKENKTVTLIFRTPSRKLIGLMQPGERRQNQRERAMSTS